MKHTVAGLMLGMLLSSPVLADTSIDTTAFSLTFLDGPLPEDWNIALAGQSGNTYHVDLASLNNHLQRIEANDVTGLGSWDSRSDWALLGLDVHAGYRVTGLTVTGTAFGEYAPGELPDFPPGRAANYASFHMTLWAPGPQSYWNQYDNFNGEHALDVGTGALSLTAPAQLGLSGALSVEAWGVEGDGAYAGSFASAQLRDLVLHVEVAPVPEPATYAMLLAGLALVGRAVRRR
jgi:hypothetical protein